MSGNVSSPNQAISQDTLVNPNGTMLIPLVDKTRALGDQNVKAPIDDVVSNSTAIQALTANTSAAQNNIAILQNQVAVLQAQIIALESAGTGGGGAIPTNFSPDFSRDFG